MEVEGLKAEQNKVSKQIPQMKKAGEDTSAIMAEMKQIAERVKGLDAERSETEGKLKEALLCIPNVPDDRVPAGTDDSCNPEVRRWGEPKSFDFEAQAHWDIGAKLGGTRPGDGCKGHRIAVPLFIKGLEQGWNAR